MGHTDIISMFADGEPRRGSLRRRVMLTARLATSTAAIDVTIRDVSATGARIEGEGLPRAGTNVVLRRGVFSVYGELVWSDGASGGVAFESPLDEDTMMETLKGIPASVTRQEPYRRPGLKRGEHARWSDGRGWIEPPPPH